MFLLFWIVMILFLSSRNSDSGTAAKLIENCYGPLLDYCITSNIEPIRAEAGLCVVIPCSFTTAKSFTSEHMSWYKCKDDRYFCQSSEEMIFSSDQTSEISKTEFKGRVSLLESDVNQKNCSIMINDLTESDSGWYQFRVTGIWNDKTDGFSFNRKSQISVEALKQKPTMMVPPLTEGQQTTLTCSDPGLCSGSPPAIIWMWRGAGEEDTSIPGSISAVPRTSYLTFNPTAKHHDTNLTCRVRFRGNITTEETVTLTVNYIKEVQIIGRRDVMEGETLNLTCSVDSFPPSLIMWTKYHSSSNLSTNNESASLIVSKVTSEYSGLYTCTIRYKNRGLEAHADVSVRRHSEIDFWRNILPWIFFGISFAVNLILIIFIWLFWNRKQKPGSNREDRTYMSLRKSEISPDYDVIAARPR